MVTGLRLLQSTVMGCLSTAVLVWNAVDLAVGAESRVPRIGIISDQSMKAQADLLMIEMQKKKVELVERDEIDKILREQSLTIGGLTGKSSLRVGQLLKADGLVLIKSEGDDVSFVRLVAVSPGVMIWYGKLSTGTKSEDWVKTVSGALSSYLPKLSVEKNQAIPVSLLRTRSLLDTFQAEQYAKNVNQLLVLRCVIEPSLFVLERENLMRMEEENRWAGQVSEFWSGSCVLASSVSHDLAETNKVTLRFTVSTAPRVDGKAPGVEKEFVETGYASELSKLVDEVVAKICIHLSAQSVKKSWDPKAEAQAFVRLAKSQVDLLEQKNSLETAMTLGLHDHNLGAMYRDVLVRQAEGRSFRASWFAFRGSVDYNRPSPAYDCSKSDIQKQAEIVLNMLRFAASYSDDRGWLQQSVIPDEGPFIIAGRFLAIIEDAKRDKDMGDLLQQIRTEGRKLGERVWFEGNSKASIRRNFYQVQFLRFFYDSSEEMLRVFHLFYDEPRTGTESVGGRAPQLYLKRELINPAFASTSRETKEQRDAMWETFLKKGNVMSDPMNAEDRILAAAKQYSQPDLDNATSLGARKILQELLWENRQILVSSKLDIWELLGLAYRQTGPHPGGAGETEECTRSSAMFLFLCNRPEITDKTIVEKAWPRLLKPDCSGAYAYVPQMRALYQSVHKRKENTSTGEEDKSGLDRLTTALVKRYPILKETKIESTRPLVVERLIEWPHEARKGDVLVSGMSGALGPYLKDNRLWFHHYGDVLALDLETRKVEKLGEFNVPLMRGASIFVVATDSFCIFVVNRGTQPYSFLAVRKRNGGVWSSGDQQVTVRHVVEAKGVLYALILRYGPKRAKYPTVAVIDPATLTFTLILDPLLLANDKLPDTDLARLWRIGSSDGELLVECRRGRREAYYAWNPEDKSWQTTQKERWLKTKVDQNPHRDASKAFGFEVLPVNEGDWQMLDEAYMYDMSESQNTMCNGHDQTTTLRIRNLTTLQEMDIPIQSKKPCTEGPILTKTAVLFRLQRTTPGFHEIPYTDIQALLKNNVPSVRTNATTTISLPVKDTIGNQTENAGNKTSAGKLTDSNTVVCAKAVLHYARRDVPAKDILRMFGQVAETGDVRGTMWIARCYRHGDTGLPTDDQKANETARKVLPAIHKLAKFGAPDKVHHP